MAPPVRLRFSKVGLAAAAREGFVLRSRFRYRTVAIGRGIMIVPKGHRCIPGSLGLFGASQEDQMS